jgi:hypothetical protein
MHIDSSVNKTLPVDTIMAHSWSKEALFGLLAELFAILMPTMALLGRYVYCWWNMRQTKTPEGI